MRICFLKFRFDGASNFSVSNDDCDMCSVEQNTSHMGVDYVLSNKRRNQFQEKIIALYKGYEHLSKTQQIMCCKYVLSCTPICHACTLYPHNIDCTELLVDQ